jgi:hypothetical protein
MNGITAAGGHADARWRLLVLVGVMLAVLGAKALLIARAGSPTPYWDQWDAEAAGLYLPYLSNTLSRADWFAFHNEHRIVLSRATALALLRLDGTWDPILQMLFNALLHVAGIGLLVTLLGRLLDSASLLAFAAFATLLFAVPFGYDNTLSGFQIAFYGLVLFSLTSLHLTCHAEAWTARWIIGTLFAVAGYFSLASGALILPAAIALASMQFATGLRRGARELSGIAVHVVITAALLADTLSLAPNEATRPQSIGAFLESLLVIASWPIAARSWPTALRIIPAALMYAPLIIFAWRFLKGRHAIEDRRWFILALGVWMAVQVFALAYGRLGAQSESRYADIFLVGATLGAATWLYLLRDGLLTSRPALAIATVWLFAMTLGTGQKALNNVADGVAARSQTGHIQTENARRFIASGDFAHLSGKPALHIPFWSAERLRDLLSNPALRSIMPSALTGAPEHNRIKRAALSAGPMLLPFGLALLLVGAMALYLRGRSSASPDPP